MCVNPITSDKDVNKNWSKPNLIRFSCDWLIRSASGDGIRIVRGYFTGKVMAKQKNSIVISDLDISRSISVFDRAGPIGIAVVGPCRQSQLTATDLALNSLRVSTNP
jgi:ethanolamine utilization microcompartment shell protein EutS